MAVTSDPSGAEVVRSDGVVVGTTPVTLKLDKGAPSLEVKLSLDGYRPETRTILSDLNREIDVNLLKASGKRATRSSSGKPSPSVASPSTPAKPPTPSPPTAQACRHQARRRQARHRRQAEGRQRSDRLLIPTQL